MRSLFICLTVLQSALGFEDQNLLQMTSKQFGDPGDEAENTPGASDDVCHDVSSEEVHSITKRLAHVSVGGGCAELADYCSNSKWSESMMVYCCETCAGGIRGGLVERKNAKAASESAHLDRAVAGKGGGNPVTAVVNTVSKAGQWVDNNVIDPIGTAAELVVVETAKGIDRAVKATEQLGNQISDTLIEGFEKAGNFLSKAGRTAEQWLRWVIQKFKALMESAGNSLRKVKVCGEYPLKNPGKTVSACVREVTNNQHVKNILNVIDSFTALGSSFSNAVSGWLGDGGMYKAIFGVFGKAAIDFFEDLFSGNPSLDSLDVQKMAKSITRIIAVYWRKHATPVATAGNQMVESVRKMVEDAWNALKTQINKVFEAKLSLLQDNSSQRLLTQIQTNNFEYWYFGICGEVSASIFGGGVCVYFPFSWTKGFKCDQIVFEFNMGLQAEGLAEAEIPSIKFGPIFHPPTADNGFDPRIALQGNAFSFGVDIDFGPSGKQFALDLGLTWPYPKGDLISFDIQGGFQFGANKAVVVGADGADFSPFYGEAFGLPIAATCNNNGVKAEYSHGGVGNGINNGDVVWIKSKRYEYIYADTGGARAAAGCPNSAANRRNQNTHQGCWGERIRIYNAENTGPIQNGQVVWLKWPKFQWLYCDTGSCRAAAGCPNDVNQRKIQSANQGCWGERFRIYNSENSGYIKHGHTIWLKSAKFNWLYCDRGSCRAAAGCPNNVQNRAVTSDTGCWGERFVIHSAKDS